MHGLMVFSSVPGASRLPFGNGKHSVKVGERSWSWLNFEKSARFEA